MAKVDVSVPSDMSPGSEFHLCADPSGGVLSGPVGKLVARVLKGDVRKSVENLSHLQSTASSR